MARKRQLSTPLGDVHRAFLAEEVARHIPRARDRNDPMARISRFMIDSLLWCWTADGLDPQGNAVRDGTKYDLRHQRHTEQAHKLWTANGERGAGLRHEHAVPKSCLIEYLLNLENATPSSVQENLKKFCFAIIVSKPEDDLLNEKFRNSMPPTWSFTAPGCDPMARYVACNLDKSIRAPLLSS